MKLNFEWDEEKAKANLKKHRISFDEAITVFTDPFSTTIADPDHSADEQRYIDIGSSDNGHVLVVVYTERNSNIIRIISYRKATSGERKLYEKGSS
ncbi:MAG: BrnT family toxin [Pseudomonadota bacterium]